LTTKIIGIEQFKKKTNFIFIQTQLQTPQIC